MRQFWNDFHLEAIKIVANVYLCSSSGGCHCVIISDDERADPTKPTGGPDGAILE